MQCGDGPAKTELDCFCIGVRVRAPQRIVENGFVMSRKYLESGSIPHPQAMEPCRGQGIQEGRVGRVHAEHQCLRGSFCDWGSLRIPCLLIQDSRKLSGKYVRVREGPLRVSVEGHATESGFVWSTTAWGVASLHAIHAPPGVSKTPRLDFLSRLSYEGGVNKRSLPLYTLTNS